MTTETDWRELPAGPELDALIAEQVMGKIVHIIGGVPRVQGGGPDSGSVTWTAAFPYSRDMAPMNEVVDTMRRRGYRFAVYTIVPTNQDLPPDRWAMAVTFSTGRGRGERGGTQLSGEEESPDHDLARAVCLAALRALNP